MARCIFCGYCEIACPFDAITLGNDFELSEISRDALVYTKDMLLEPPLRRTPAQDPEQFDRGAQEIEGAGVLGMYHVVLATNHDEVQWRLMAPIVLFYVAGAAAIGSAIARGRAAQPVPLGALADPATSRRSPTLYLVLQADFVAVAQLLVYAGAVMVMFLFVIAYLGRSGGSRPADAAASARSPRASQRFAIFVESVIAVSDRPARCLRPAGWSHDSFGSPADDRAAVPDRPPAAPSRRSR